MKKSIVGILCLIFSLNIYAQKNNLKIHSTEFGFGGAYVKKNNFEAGGFSFVVDLTTSFGKNLISTSFLAAPKNDLIIGSNYNFNEFRIQYGRELSLNNWIKLEGFAGVGYFHQNRVLSEIVKDNAISFPLKLNAKFYVAENYAIGLNTNYSFNRINNVLSANVIFQFKFK